MLTFFQNNKKKTSLEFNKIFPNEFFVDINSENDFEGFNMADIYGEVVENGMSEINMNVWNGYYHWWLSVFKESSGYKEIPDDISEWQLFLFIYE